MATELKLKEDIKKLKAAISSKATQEKFKAKLKNQLGDRINVLQDKNMVLFTENEELKDKILCAGN